MKVIKKLQQKSPTLSFEFFPPKTAEQETQLFRAIGELKNFNPDFVSVTYGALGTTREKTFYWAGKIKKDFQIEPVAHLTCIAATRQSILEQLETLEKMEVENILALRGDPPAESKRFNPPPDGFRYAKELISFIKKEKPGFCLGAAGYPEGHPEAENLTRDIENLKEKIEAGAEYVITQLFFDNNHYFNFVERCRKAGITTPIIAGIMPITSYKLIKKMTRVCGATIPPRLLSELEKNRSNLEAVKKIGIEQAVKQCQELLRQDIPGLHFFVLNQSGPISQILSQLKISSS